MSGTAFSHLMAVTLGTIAGCFVVALILGSIIGVFSRKKRTGDEFKAHRNKVIFAVYWWYLFITIPLGYARGDFRNIDLTTIYCSTFITSIIIYLLYHYIKKAILNKNKSQNKVVEAKPKTTQNNKKTDNYEGSEPHQPIHTTATSEERSVNPNESEEYWGLISFAYGKIKQTNVFKLWRKEQFDCQFGKCAICNKPMELKFSQVDHIKPRYKKGTNYSNNLALVHKKCNELKSAKTGYERPTWIKENKYSAELDEKVYEITEGIRADYPTKFPDELFKKPTHKT